jgi:hypothetical protein
MQVSFARRALVLALVASGFAMTWRVFAPGIVNWDSGWIRDMARTGRFEDWQSPVMGLIWREIERLGIEGSFGMFALTILLFWTGVALLALHAARTSTPRAVIVVLMGLAPPVFVILGVVWRDVFFASLWLLAVALAVTSLDQPARTRWLLRGLAIVLILVGYLCRSNALFAAPVLLVYAVRPEAFAWKRLAVAYVPLVVALFALMQVMFYGVLQAERKNALHSVFVFDLAGISHFSGQSVFPVTYTPEQTRMIETSCYNPAYWDAVWLWEPCSFVMKGLTKPDDPWFGTPRLRPVWLRAIVSNPVAYVRHRLAYFNALLTRQNLVLWTIDVLNPEVFKGQPQIRTDDPVFMAHRRLTETLHATTPLYRTGLYLGLAMVLTVIGWRRRDDAQGALALASGLSAVVFVSTYAVFGVAAEYRYGLWATFAALFGLAMVAGTARRRSAP